MAQRGNRLAATLLCVACAGVGAADAVEFPHRYLSKRNRERPLRAETSYIILHTTEGGARGSLDKLAANGEAHYMVDERGRLYRILHRDKVAYHSGVSMWNGRCNLDARSIGIEVVGTYNGTLTDAQCKTLRGLLASLQRAYRIPDERVLTHSMVAYSPPNQWYKRAHRGRKRCGMLFASPSVRQRLGLSAQPSADPDVSAGRLIQADPYLASRLYPRRSLGSPAAAHRPPTPPASARAAQVRAAPTPPPAAPASGAPLTVGAGGRSAASVAGAQAESATTFYFLPGGGMRTGNVMPAALLQKLPAGTVVLVNYVNGGRVTAKRSAFDICGPRWNDPATLYRLPDGTLRAGHTMSERTIPLNATVFFRR